MTEPIRWLRDARIDERMHAQGLPLDMMLSVDRGSDAVVLRVTARYMTRAEARELGSRLIEAALLAGERDDVERERPVISPSRTREKRIVKVVDRVRDVFVESPGGFRMIMEDGEPGPATYTLDEISEDYGISKVHLSDGSVQNL